MTHDFYQHCQKPLDQLSIDLAMGSSRYPNSAHFLDLSAHFLPAKPLCLGLFECKSSGLSLPATVPRVYYCAFRFKAPIISSLRVHFNHKRHRQSSSYFLFWTTSLVCFRWPLYLFWHYCSHYFYRRHLPCWLTISKLIMVTFSVVLHLQLVDRPSCCLRSRQPSWCAVGNPRRQQLHCHPRHSGHSTQRHQKYGKDHHCFWLLMHLKSGLALIVTGFLNRYRRFELVAGSFAYHWDHYYMQPY